MIRPEIAHEWAVQRRSLLNEVPPADDAWEDERSNDPRWSAVARLAGRRCAALSSAASETYAAISSLWIERVDSGFVATSLHALDGEFVLLTDVGLQHMIDVASVLVARHYRDSSFEPTNCTDSSRLSFGRLSQVLIGQFYLYGRLSLVPPGLLRDDAVAQRVAEEAALFVLAHELGHAVASTQHHDQGPYWLDSGLLSDDLRGVAVEVEADAFAVALCFSDLWGSHVGEAEATLRILAIRATLNIVEAVETASLVPRVYRHLPARRRWEGIRSFLNERFPQWLLARTDGLWNAMAEALTFMEASELQAPPEGILRVLAREDWIVECGADEQEEWARQEMAVWQFRLPPPILEYLIGADAFAMSGDANNDHAEIISAGHTAVTQLLESLPAWLVGDDNRRLGQATSGELIAYLRLRERWPTPFADGAPLPIHLMAAAIHRRLNGRLPRTSVGG